MSTQSIKKSKDSKSMASVSMKSDKLEKKEKKDPLEQHMASMLGAKRKQTEALSKPSKKQVEYDDAEDSDAEEVKTAPKTAPVKTQTKTGNVASDSTQKRVRMEQVVASKSAPVKKVQPKQPESDEEEEEEEDEEEYKHDVDSDDYQSDSEDEETKDEDVEVAPKKKSSAPAPARLDAIRRNEGEVDPLEDFDPNGSNLNYEFDSLDIHENTQKAIKAMGFTRMTEVQARCIPILLKGRDILGAAKTGSGKTLAFLIPSIELLLRTEFKSRNGTGVIVISPTRELCIQIYGVVQELCGYHNLTHGVIMGGTNRHAESERLRKGVTLVVGTPGRLLDHLRNTRGFVYEHLLGLVIDEADRILEIGFEEDLRGIIKMLPQNRQTMFFSATQTKNVQDIARVSVRTPVFVGVHEEAKVSTATGIEQGYVLCPCDMRFLLLFTFLKKNMKKKILVFFSTCNAVKYYGELLNYIDVPVLDLHGQQKQKKRTSTFFEFCNAERGIMLCTDVAARGLDIPSVDWIIQFDPPSDPKEYIHRVGRTARGLNATGRALLFLMPEELPFLKHLKAAKIPLNEFEFPQEKIAKVQNQLESVVEKNYFLHKSAREAFRSFVQAYAQHPLKDAFNAQNLDMLAVAKSFGFVHPPTVSLAVSLKARPAIEARDNQKNRHGFDDENPYGRGQQSSRKGDGNKSRQWSR